MTSPREVMGGGVPEDVDVPIGGSLLDVTVDDRAFFQSGIVEIHHPAPRGNDTALSISEAAALTRALNDGQELKKRFIDGVVPVFRNRVPGSGIVQVMVPSSPYAYGGVMVISIGETLVSSSLEQLAEIGEPVSTTTAFDLEPSLRQEYYRQILACIHAEEELLLPRGDNDNRVMAYENTVVSVSNQHHRLPRTIALPHMHVIKSGDWINDTIRPPRPLGFSLEQRISQDQNLFARFRDEWFVPAMGQAHLDSTRSSRLELRSEPPYGYTIVTDIARANSLESQAWELSDLLLAHHSLYAEFAESEAERINQLRAERRRERIYASGMILPALPSVEDKFTLQPAYRTYLYYRDEKLMVTISPMFLTTLGAMEGMEAAVDRSIHHNKLFSDEELTQFFDDLSARLEQLLGSRDPLSNEPC